MPHRLKRVPGSANNRMMPQLHDHYMAAPSNDSLLLDDESVNMRIQAGAEMQVLHPTDFTDEQREALRAAVPNALPIAEQKTTNKFVQRATSTADMQELPVFKRKEVKNNFVRPEEYYRVPIQKLKIEPSNSDYAYDRYNVLEYIANLNFTDEDYAYGFQHPHFGYVGLLHDSYTFNNSFSPIFNECTVNMPPNNNEAENVCARESATNEHLAKIPDPFVAGCDFHHLPAPEAMPPNDVTLGKFASLNEWRDSINSLPIAFPKVAWSLSQLAQQKFSRHAFDVVNDANHEEFMPMPQSPGLETTNKKWRSSESEHYINSIPNSIFGDQVIYPTAIPADGIQKRNVVAALRHTHNIQVPDMFADSKADMYAAEVAETEQNSHEEEADVFTAHEIPHDVQFADPLASVSTALASDEAAPEAAAASEFVVCQPVAPPAAYSWMEHPESDVVTAASIPDDVHTAVDGERSADEHTAVEEGAQENRMEYFPQAAAH